MRWFQNSVKFLAFSPAKYPEVVSSVRAVAPGSATRDLAVIHGYALFAAANRTSTPRGGYFPVNQPAISCGSKHTDFPTGKQGIPPLYAPGFHPMDGQCGHFPILETLASN